ncbi:hypothetical protein Aduo_002327 [Ancylostoma duodenale]
MTALGNIWNYRSNQFEQLLFFFDTGAQKTIIKEEIAVGFGLSMNKTEVCVLSGIEGHTGKFQSSSVNLKISNAYGAEFHLEIQTEPVITNGFPSVKLTEIDKEFLQKNEINLCNPRVRGEYQTPHILVGLDYYYNLAQDSGNNNTTPSGLHIAKTVFGPTLHGRGSLAGTKTQPDTVTYGLTALFNYEEHEALQKMYELEGLGTYPEEDGQDDKTNYFIEYSKRISYQNGQITAPFPLKDNVGDLNDNYPMAIKRLTALQAQLKNNDQLQLWYCKIFDDYIKNDVIDVVTGPIADTVGTYYMPHLGVWRTNKAKPLRIVFDASSHQKGKLSLNDVIHKGQSFINKVYDILTANRMEQIILMCDIEVAFTQIRITDSHKDLCRLLWLRDVTRPPTRNNLIEYRFKR